MPTHLSHLLPEILALLGVRRFQRLLRLPRGCHAGRLGHSIGAALFPVSAVEGGSIITVIDGGVSGLAACDLTIGNPIHGYDRVAGPLRLDRPVTILLG